MYILATFLRTLDYYKRKEENTDINAYSTYAELREFLWNEIGSIKFCAIWRREACFTCNKYYSCDHFKTFEKGHYMTTVMVLCELNDYVLETFRKVEDCGAHKLKIDLYSSLCNINALKIAAKINRFRVRQKMSKNSSDWNSQCDMESLQMSEHEYGGTINGFSEQTNPSPEMVLKEHLFL